MDNRRLGRTNLQVSELCLTTANFGWIDDEATSLTLLDTYHTCGGKFIQTLGFCPHSAAAQAMDTSSEDIVGRWHQSRSIHRDRLILATRLSLFRPVHGGSIAFANVIREACEGSLRRLRTKHLDRLICGWDEQLLPVADLLEAVDQLIRAGLVRHVAAGGFPPWRVVDSLHRSGLRNHARLEAMQGDYSLMTRTRFEAETLALCREHRLGFLARSPLAGGFLAQRPAVRHELLPDRSWQNERFGSNLGDAVRTALAEIADQRSATPAQIALAWVLRNPHVTSALVSTASPRELLELNRALDVVLTDEDIGMLVNVTTVRDSHRELRNV